jgi:putative tricarboxylic transport membrane protein
MVSKQSVSCGLAALWCGIALWATSAAAQQWAPSRPVAFVVGSAAGGGIDLTARLLQRIWEQNATVKAPVVVINKPGAGNSVAWSYLNERGGDGYAIAIGTANLVSNPTIGLLGYRDVTPLALLFDDYFVLMVRADSPIKSLADVKQRLMRDPAAVSFGFGPGLGAGTHIAAAVAAKAMGADVRKGRFIPYRNAGEAVTGMLSGEIDIVSGTAVTAPAFIASGRVRALAVMSAQRLSGQLARVPTAREQGVDAEYINWRGVVGPKGMGKPQAAFWVHALEAVRSTEAWQKELQRNFWTDNFKAGAAFDRFLSEQEDAFRRVWAEIGSPS